MHRETVLWSRFIRRRSKPETGVRTGSFLAGFGYVGCLNFNNVCKGYSLDGCFFEYLVIIWMKFTATNYKGDGIWE